MEFPYGTIVDPPPGFAPPEMWPEFGQIAQPPSLCAREIVGIDPQGIRWSLGPLCFEYYVSDIEPDLTASSKGKLAKNRLIMWRRLRATEVLPPWWKKSSRPSRIDGFYRLDERDYTRAWHHNARRDVKIWREKFLNVSYVVEQISFEEFGVAYKKSTARKKAGGDLYAILERKYHLPHVAQHLAFIGVRNKHTREIVAGTALLYSPTFNSSIRECPFSSPEGNRVYASTGLIDYWFATSQKQKVSFLFFAYFWYPGEPTGWKGFSEFKSHFGLSFIAYPPILYRFMRGRLW